MHRSLVIVLGILKQSLEAFFQTKEAFEVILLYVLLGCFRNFSLDPYYEPLLWFMIHQINQIFPIDITF